MEEETKALQIRFPVAMYNKLSENAEKSRRSLNSEVIVCLEKYFDELEQKETLTLTIEGKDLDNLHEKMNIIYEYVKNNDIPIINAGMDLEKYKALSPAEQKKVMSQLNKMVGKDPEADLKTTKK